MTLPLLLIMTSLSPSVNSVVDVGEEQPELRTSRESLLSLKSNRPLWRKSVGESVVVLRCCSNSVSSSDNLGEEEISPRTEFTMVKSV